jgi:hypothetical protein
MNELGQNHKNINSIVLTDGTELDHGVIAYRSSINGTSFGTQTIYLNPLTSLVTLYPICFLFKFQAPPVGLTGTLVAKIGDNGSHDNMMPSTTFTGFTSIGSFWIHQPTGRMAPAFPGDTTTMDITTQFGGSSVYLDVYVLGLRL